MLNAAISPRSSRQSIAPAVGILDRVAPDRRIEKRHAHADHAVAAIALGERVAEHLVERGDVLEARPRTGRRGACAGATAARSAISRPLPPPRAPAHRASSPASGSAGASSRCTTRRARLRVVAHRDHAVEPLAHRLDVRDENDLLEPVLQPRAAARRRSARRELVERAEDLVEDRAARSGWPARSAIICEIASRSTRFARSSSPPEITGFGHARPRARARCSCRRARARRSAPSVSSVRNALASSRQLGPQLEVQVGAQIGVGAIELVVQALVRRRARRAAAARSSSSVAAALARLRVGHRGRLRLAVRAHRRQLRGAQLGGRALVLARAASAKSLLRERERVAPRRELARCAPRARVAFAQRAATARASSAARARSARSGASPCASSGMQAVELAAHALVARAHRSRRESPRARAPAPPRAPPSPRCSPRELRQLLHRELHLRQPPLELRDLVEQRAPPLVERAHRRRHLERAARGGP